MNCICVRLADRETVCGTPYSPRRHYDLTILLRNFAVAGALCAAFRDGWNCRFIIAPNGVRTPWQPGCGREVPR